MGAAEQQSNRVQRRGEGVVEERRRHILRLESRPGHKGGLLKRTDVHHRLSYIHKFITSVRACAVHSHRLHVSPSWLGCSTIYVHSRDQPQ